jgi:signal transduction histidine kinase
VLGLGAVAAILLGVEIPILLAGPVEPSWVSLVLPVVGMIYVVVGCVAWDRRPSNRTGAVLIMGGVTMELASLVNSGFGALAATGSITATLPLAVVTHLLLAFPSGVLRGRARVLSAVVYAVTLPLQAPQYLFGGTGTAFAFLTVADRPDLAHAGRVVQTTVGSVALVLCLVLVIDRLRRYDRSRRRVLRWLLGYWSAATLWAPFAANVLGRLLGLGPVDVYVCQVVVLGGVPLVFGAALLRGGFARMRGAEELLTWIGLDRGARPELRTALAVTLGDPSVTLWYACDQTGGFVDGSGVPAGRQPGTGERRGLVRVADGPRVVGLLEYDATLLPDPGPVEEVGRLVMLEVDRERLTAELRAQQHVLRASRARLVEATDRERRRIAQDLHDGMQGQLIVLGLHVADLARRADQVGERALLDLRDEVAAAVVDLSRLVYGVMPPLLVEQGLYAAVEELAEQAPLPVDLMLPSSSPRPPRPVESAAYFFVAEAITNTLKHGAAQHVEVVISRSAGGLRVEVGDDGAGGAALGTGLGLRGIADRVDSLGGQLVVRSDKGHGTLLRIELPCAW